MPVRVTAPIRSAGWHDASLIQPITFALFGSHCHTPSMFTAAVLDHFRNPRNAGELAKADARVEVSNPVCGDVLQLAARFQNGRISEVRFLCRGCTTAIACASLLTAQLQGAARNEIARINAESLSQILGGLPAATFHGAELAAEAARALLQKIPNSPDNPAPQSRAAESPGHSG
jgi:nitrogen fixation protein NifU and related proteins